MECGVMALQRVDRLKEPPVVGQSYLVPTVYGRWYDKIGDWPVIGHRHNDVEFFHFVAQHYHIDYRFVTVRKSWLRNVSAGPLHAQEGFPLSKPILRRRQCKREQHVFGGPSRIMSPFRESYAGQQCAKGKRGWVCPHRHIALGSTPAIDGVITCPLHGLRIDAATGKCLSPTPEQTK
jgi:hypothetical protein